MKFMLMTVATGAALMAAARDEVRVTTFENPWREAACIEAACPADSVLTVDVSRVDQEILGFGTAVSELSWKSLSALTAAECAKVLDELFSSEGGNFTVVRAPIGASDFALDYYSYDDHPGDFAMDRFSVETDERALLPLLREIVRRVPADTLKVWASPWCPPRWLKKSGRYASRPPSYSGEQPNDCAPADRVYEGEDGFTCDEAHFRAYARYFRKYVDAYRAAGVPVWMVMPQNEFNSAMPYPSCTWTVRSLVAFMGGYLGPALEGSGTELYLGTVERGTIEAVDAVLKDPACARYVKGAGFQWGGKQSIGAVRARYPNLFLMQTEQECGNGLNDWKHARHCWELMRHYFGNGASAYEYWNLALDDGSLSRWGWRQNSLVSVSPAAKTWRFNVEYYVLKHLSRFVRRGARRLVTAADEDALAFANPDGSVVVALGNETDAEKVVGIRLDGGSGQKAVCLPPKSLATVRFGK